MSDLISRQAAIDAHYEYCNKHPDAGFPVWSLKILKDLPSAQPESCEDAVSRADVVDMLEMFPFTEYSEYETAREVVRRLPSAQPEQTKMIKEIRKWINSGSRGSADYFIVDKIEEIINKYE